MARSTGIPELSTSSLNDQSNQGIDVIQIKDLKPSLKKFTIKARVIYKSPIKTTMKGDGTFIFFSLLDQSAEISAVAFGNETDLLTSLNDILEMNEVYCIPGTDVQKASEEYNLLENPFEIIIHDYTSIEKSDDSGNIPNMPKIKFQPIKKIKSLPTDTFVNVIGVCNDASFLMTILEDGIEVDIRNLELMDANGKSITLTLWREDAEDEKKFNWQDNTVIVARNVKVYETYFKNETLLNFVGASMLFVNPNMPEAIQLRRRLDK